MSKRSVLDLLDDEKGIDEINVKDIIKEKKLKKKPAATVTATTVSSAEEVGECACEGSILDEIMSFTDDSADKFQKTVQISPDVGIGITSNYFSIFRISKKNGKFEISNYQFSIKNSVIPNLIQALRKIYRSASDKKNNI
jgi:DNA polymerase III delta prime subunit